MIKMALMAGRMLWLPSLAFEKVHLSDQVPKREIQPRTLSLRQSSAAAQT